MSDFDYDGWAPCVHHDADIAKATGLIANETPDFSGTTKKPWRDVHGGVLEDMIWQLTDLTRRGDIQFDCDQWWGVFITGTMSDADKKTHTFKTRVQADTLLLGVAESLRWWGEKYKELHDDGERQLGQDPTAGHDRRSIQDEPGQP